MGILGNYGSVGRAEYDPGVLTGITSRYTWLVSIKKGDKAFAMKIGYIVAFEVDDTTGKRYAYKTKRVFLDHDKTKVLAKGSMTTKKS